MQSDEIEKKKKFLKEYEKAVNKMERSKRILQEAQMCRICPAIANDGMPHAHNNGDLSSYAVLLERAKNEYIKCRYHRIKKYREVLAKVQEIVDEDERKILAYRYINLLKWRDIQEKLGMKERQVYRIHTRALKNLKI